MNLYLVDFENVNEQGLNGADDLNRSDRVVIYYGPQNKNISFGLHIMLQQSKACFEYVRTEKVARNYLDFYMTASLSTILARKHYDQVFIISKDRGFDPVVDYWSEQSVTISQRPAITP